MHNGLVQYLWKQKRVSMFGVMYEQEEKNALTLKTVAGNTIMVCTCRVSNLADDFVREEGGACQCQI